MRPTITPLGVRLKLKLSLPSGVAALMSGRALTTPGNESCSNMCAPRFLEAICSAE
jgi:hypothetical protein